MKGKDATAKEIYKIIKNRRLQKYKQQEAKWQNMLQKMGSKMANYVAKKDDELDWEKILETVHNSRVSYKIQSTIWSQINRSYLTNFDINQTKPYHSANCKYCNQIETEQHHLLKCPIAVV